MHQLLILLQVPMLPHVINLHHCTWQSNHHTIIIYTYRVIKETMRGGGGNITKSHAEDVSLSGKIWLEGEN